MHVRGIAFWKTHEENITTHREWYKQFLEQYVKRWARQHRISRPMLLYDNARPHKAEIVREFIEKRTLVGTKSSTIFSWHEPLSFQRFWPLQEETVRNPIKQQLYELDTAINTNQTLHGVLQLLASWVRVINNNGNYWLLP